MLTIQHNTGKETIPFKDIKDGELFYSFITRCVYLKITETMNFNAVNLNYNCILHIEQDYAVLPVNEHTLSYTI